MTGSIADAIFMTLFVHTVCNRLNIAEYKSYWLSNFYSIIKGGTHSDKNFCKHSSDSTLHLSLPITCCKTNLRKFNKSSRDHGNKK